MNAPVADRSCYSLPYVPGSRSVNTRPWLLTARHKMEPISWENASQSSSLAAVASARVAKAAARAAVVVATALTSARPLDLVARLTACRSPVFQAIPVGRSVQSPRFLSPDPAESCPLSSPVARIFGSGLSFPGPARLVSPRLIPSSLALLLYWTEMGYWALMTSSFGHSSHLSWTTTYVDLDCRTSKTLPVSLALTWCTPRRAATPTAEGRSPDPMQLLYTANLVPDLSSSKQLPTLRPRWRSSMDSSSRDRPSNA